MKTCATSFSLKCVTPPRRRRAQRNDASHQASARRRVAEQPSKWRPSLFRGMDYLHMNVTHVIQQRSGQMNRFDSSRFAPARFPVSFSSFFPSFSCNTRVDCVADPSKRSQMTDILPVASWSEIQHVACCNSNTPSLRHFLLLLLLSFYCAQTQQSPLRTGLKYNNGNKSARLPLQRKKRAWREEDLWSDSVWLLFCVWFLFLFGRILHSKIYGNHQSPPLPCHGNFRHLLGVSWKLARRATFTAVDLHSVRAVVNNLISNDWHFGWVSPDQSALKCPPFLPPLCRLMLDCLGGPRGWAAAPHAAGRALVAQRRLESAVCAPGIESKEASVAKPAAFRRLAQNRTLPSDRQTDRHCVAAAVEFTDRFAVKSTWLLISRQIEYFKFPLFFSL